MKQPKKKPLFVLFGIDLILFGAALVIFAYFHHVFPRQIGNRYGSTQAPDTLLDWSEKFPDKFTDGDVLSGENYYQDENVNLTIQTVQENGVTYYVADFYIRNIEVLRTAMASESFATGITDTPLNIAQKNNALLALSGDYFGVRQRSVVIRNGEILRKSPAHHDICILFYDGTVEIHQFALFDIDRIVSGGAWQAWDFGPSLLDENGKSKTEFPSSYRKISGPNPRAAFGYFEPGHYCFVAVDGRQSHSKGISFEDLSVIMERLGCQKAYNLDGGQSAAMAFRGELVSSPASGGREISDIIYLFTPNYVTPGKENP